MCQQLAPTQTPDEVVLLDTRFHKVKVCQLIDYIVESGQQAKKTIIGNVNVRAMNFAYTTPWFRQYINESDLVFCDGFGVLLGAKIMGYSVKSDYRMTCPDYIEDLAKACAAKDVSLYLLAGKPGVVDSAMEQMRAIAPNIRVGGHHGYFDKHGAENQAVIDDINAFKPDVLYIGFGMPLQERWMVDNLDKVDARVFLPLGACLDFYTGTVYRGPRWMTDRGMEWLARFFTEPSRLWDRYVVGNPLFFYRVFKERLFGTTPAKAKSSKWNSV